MDRNGLFPNSMPFPLPLSASQQPDLSPSLCIGVCMPGWWIRNVAPGQAAVSLQRDLSIQDGPEIAVLGVKEAT